MIVASFLLLALAAPHGECFAPTITTTSRTFSRSAFVVATPRVTSSSAVLLAATQQQEGPQTFQSAVGSAIQDLSKQANDKIVDLTGKENYAFADLATLLDEKARAAVADLTDKEEADLGDLIQLAEEKGKALMADLETKEERKQIREVSNMAGAKVQAKLADLMGEDADWKQVQEVATRELVALVKSKDYGIGDLFFLLKLCTSFGLGMNPAVMAIFPLNVLIQLYNFSLIQEAGKGVTSAIALEMDRRARNAIALELDKQSKVALFGSEDVEVGALIKKAVLDSINKSNYDIGDITRNLLNAWDKGEQPEMIGVAEKEGKAEELEPELEKELKALDKALYTEVIDAEVVDE